jgi:hypothetical protein
MEISVTLLPRIRSIAAPRRGLTACAAVLGATALTAGLTAIPASASTYLATVRWQDYQTSLCLDSNYGEAAYTDACNWNDTYQNWSYASLS